MIHSGRKKELKIAGAVEAAKMELFKEIAEQLDRREQGRLERQAHRPDAQLAARSRLAEDRRAAAASGDRHGGRDEGGRADLARQDGHGGSAAASRRSGITPRRRSLIFSAVVRLAIMRSMAAASASSSVSGKTMLYFASTSTMRALIVIWLWSNLQAEAGGSPGRLLAAFGLAVMTAIDHSAADVGLGRINHARAPRQCRSTGSAGLDASLGAVEADADPQVVPCEERASLHGVITTSASYSVDRWRS